MNMGKNTRETVAALYRALHKIFRVEDRCRFEVERYLTLFKIFGRRVDEEDTCCLRQVVATHLCQLSLTRDRKTEKCSFFVIKCQELQLDWVAS